MIKEKTGLATYKEVREFLKIGQTTLYHLVKNGQLKVVYIGARPRVEWAELDRYIEQNRQS